MKRYFSYLTTAVFVLSAVLISGCTDSDNLDNPMDGYGYVSFKLQKDPGTRADELEYLHQAHKIQLTLSNDFQLISPTLLVDYFDHELSEFGLFTENLMLRAGTYSMSGYKIYDVADNLIFEGAPGSDYSFDVQSDKITVAELFLKTVLRGALEFTLIKDFSDFARANSRQEYSWGQIGKVRIELENVDNYLDRIDLINVPTKYIAEDGTSYMKVDSTFSIPAADYKLRRIIISSGTNNATLETLDTFEKDIVFTVKDNTTTEAEIPIKLVESDMYIKDYVALRDIWEALEGPKWSWYGSTYPTGTNWDFDKDIDLWGLQPGVGLHPNGRVAALTIGQFNPQGFVPKAIGQLTELTELWIGSNTDLLDGSEESIGNGNENIYPYIPVERKFLSSADKHIDARLNRRSLSVKDVQPTGGEFPFIYKTGYNGHETILDYKKEESRLYRRPKIHSEFDLEVRKMRGETTVQPESRSSSNVPHGKVTNGITGISESIGKLTKMTHLFISNSKITALPDSLKYLTELTDVEFYNNPLLEKFPDALAELPNLIALNISKNLQWDSDEFYRGLDLLFSGAASKSIQILYADQNNLKRVPASIKNMESLGLLDLSQNQITHVAPFTKSVRPLIVYYDYNHIKEIDATDEFADWMDLEEFILSHNELETFPNIFGSDKNYLMGEVDLSFNYIKEIDGLDNGTFNGFLTTELNLSFNYLTKFPDFYSAETEITFLKIDHNAIEELTADDLRGDYAKFTTTLDMSYNKFKKMPENSSDDWFWWAETFPWLNAVDLSGNQLSEFPTQVVTSTLRTLFIAEQMTDGKKSLKSYPDSFSGRPFFVQLKISGNDIGPAVYPPTLLYLDVSDNPNIYMDLSNLTEEKCATLSNRFLYDKTQNIIGCKGYVDTNANKD